MSNFDFLKDFDETLYKLGDRIEKEVKISPSAVKADATPFLQYILEKLLNRIGRKFNSRKDFYSQLDAVYRNGVIDYNYKNKIYSAYLLRNKIHDNFDEMEKNELAVALSIHEKLFNIAKKYCRDFNENYDEYKGLPSYKPIELDSEDDEIELVKIPDFSEIIDFKYDYCVICGEPNHSNYSLCCPKCSRVLDNANNFISIRNYFGKDAKFTKEDLIEYGIHEGYVNQLITHLAREDMLKVAGRFYSFNNLYFDRYMTKIDNYLAVGELITKFREDKIAPKEIKQTMEYREGSLRHEPFYEFYKIIDHEIINKFENDILATQDIWNSIEYTTITQKQLETWYMKNLGHYKRGNVNEPFVVFNELLMKDYLDLKREGLYETDIRAKLNVSSNVYEFWSAFNGSFEDEIRKINKDLLLKAFSEGKTKAEAIELAGVTSKEYDDIVKYSDFKKDEFSQIKNREFEVRKENLIEYLKHNDLESSCEMAKISVDEFYGWYEEDMASDFYLNTTRVLMHNFLNQRRKGKTKAEAAQTIGIEYRYVEHWFKRTLDICEEFKNDHVKVVVGLIHDGFKNRKSKAEIAKTADVTVNRINTYLDLGKRGYGTYKRLYDYYEDNVIPVQLDRFLKEIKTKPLKKALEISELSSEELEYCCSEGFKGNVKYKEFYESYYANKLDVFMNRISKGKNKSKALRNANLTEKEVNECYELGRNGDERFLEFYRKYHDKKLEVYYENMIKGNSNAKSLKNSDLKEDEIPENVDEIILDRKLEIVSAAIRNNLTTKQAAKRANVNVNDIYDWFLKGRSGDEKFEEFSQLYYDDYVSIGSRLVQIGINGDVPLNFILKQSSNLFSREDYNFWLENGFLKEAQEKLDEEDDDEKIDMKHSIFKKEMIK